MCTYDDDLKNLILNFFLFPENLFSVYRGKITTPTPLIFKRQTKLISLGHLFRKPKGRYMSLI